MLPGVGAYVFDYMPQYSPGSAHMQAMTDDMALARYYNNRGVEDLIAGEPELALAGMRVALHLDPEYSDGWGNIGTVFRRLGEEELAEYSYPQALEFDPRNYSAMSNLALALQARGAGDERLARSVGYYRKRNPYHHYRRAEQRFAADDLRAALRHLRRAVRLKGDEAVFHAALAVVLARMGQESGAARSWDVAARLDRAAGQRPAGAPGFVGSDPFRKTWGAYPAAEG